MVHQGSDRSRFFSLVMTYFLSVVISVARVPVEAMHPFLAGPRYFFYPYILLGWIFIWIAAETGGRMRFVIAMVPIVAVCLALPKMQRRNDKLSFGTQIRSCANSDSDRDIMVHFAGVASATWNIRLTPSDCKQALERSLF